MHNGIVRDTRLDIRGLQITMTHQPAHITFTEETLAGDSDMGKGNNFGGQRFVFYRCRVEHNNVGGLPICGNSRVPKQGINESPYPTSCRSHDYDASVSAFISPVKVNRTAK